MKKLLLSIALLTVTTATSFANCDIYVEGQGYSDQTERTVRVNPLPNKYKFSPRKMLVSKLKKKGYNVKANKSAATLEVTTFGGKCQGQLSFYDCDYAVSEIVVFNNQVPSSSFRIKRETTGMPVLLGIITNHPNILNTSGKSAFKKALNAIPSCR